MPTNIDRYKADLNALILRGERMHFDIQNRENPDIKSLPPEAQANIKKLSGEFEREYQKWYSESLALIRNLLPDRLEEFTHLYRIATARKNVDVTNYTIQDWLNGARSNINHFGAKLFNDYASVVMRYNTQLGILKSVSARFESSLFDIKQLLQADLLDSELDSARELHGKGFLRAAGAVSGVVIEKHLGQVAANHNVTIKKAHPAISDLNDALKNAQVYDTPVWRNIQRLGDLRNLCDHNKHRDPTKEEVIELIDGTEKLTKTLF